MVSNKQITILWLDDERDPSAPHGSYDDHGMRISLVKYYTGHDPSEPNTQVMWAHNYTDFRKYLDGLVAEECFPNLICFDHDLGERYNGMDCVKYLVEVCEKHGIVPSKYQFRYQSMNPGGVKNMMSYIESYIKSKQS